MSNKLRRDPAKTAGFIHPVRQALDALALGKVSPEHVVAWSIFAELGRLIARARKDVVSQEAAARMAGMMQDVLAECGIDEDSLVILNRDFVRLAARIRMTPAAEIDRHIITLSIMARLKSPLLSWERSSEK
jgi:hypothetical protein